MKLNYKRTFIVGLAFFSICAFWQLYDHVVPLMLKYTFHLEDTLAGGVMALDNILALFMLPLFGMLSDKTRTRWGRRMPYVVIGGFAACALMMSVPLVNSLALQEALTLPGGYTWHSLATFPLFIAALGLTLFVMATFRSPAVALMPDVTVKPLRSKANAVINLMGAVGGIIILGLTRLLLPGAPKEEEGLVSYSPDYFPIFWCCMAIMAVAILVLLWRVNEPKLAQKMQEDAARWGVADKPEAAKAAEKAAESTKLDKTVRKSMLFLLASVALWFMGYNAVTTAFSKYCVERFGLGAGDSALILIVAQAAAIVSYIPVGILASRIGRKKCILGGVALLALSFGIGGLFNTFSVFLYPLFVTAGIAWAAINVNSYPMVVEMAKGSIVGRFTGYYYTASMAAQVATPILSGAALQHIGYATLFPYGALFVVLSFVTMLFVRHGDAKPQQPKSKLEAFDAMDD